MSFTDKDAWRRLAAAARSAPDERDTAAPFGFATRVAALAMAEQRPAVSWLERLSWRAMAVACALAVAAVGVDYFGWRQPSEDLAAAASDDPVAQVVDLAS